jgi:Na+/proline symporter
MSEAIIVLLLAILFFLPVLAVQLNRIGYQIDYIMRKMEQVTIIEQEQNERR